MVNAALILSTLLLGQGLPKTPPGFRPAADTEIWRLGPHDLEDTTYVVSKQGDFIRVESRVDWVARVRREHKEDAVPPKVTIKLSNATGHWSPGIGVRVSDGWIHGWDAGEFGGALYWFSTDGSVNKRVDPRNTQIVAEHNGRVFAVQALNHLMFSYSRLIEVVPGAGGWTTKLVTDLHQAPGEILWDETRFILVTGSYVTTLETDGRQRELYRAPRQIMADGLVKLKNGEFWIGSSRSVLCLKPKQDGNFQAFWFRPVQKPKSPL